MSEIVRMLPKEFGGGKLGEIFTGLQGVSDADRTFLSGASLQEVLFCPSTSELTLCLDSGDIFRPERLIAPIEAAAARLLPSMHVTVRFSGSASAEKSAPAVTLEEWVEIRESLKNSYPALGAWLNLTRFDNPETGEGTLVCATRMAAERLRAAEIERLVADRIRDRLGRILSVRVELGEVDLPDSRPDVIVRSEIRPAAQVLMGAQRGTKSSVTPLREISGSMRSVIVEGTVLNPEVRDLRRPLLSFVLSDRTDSLRVKLFDPPPKMQALVAGDRLRIRGSIAPDKFEYEEPVLRPIDVLRVPEVSRVDTAVEKRVELNLHTKSSRLNGLIDLDAMIARAKEWQWEGFAITDDAVVQAFPKAYSSARKAGLRLGLGCQIHFANDLKPIAWNLPRRSGARALSLNRPAVVFDLETTGLGALSNRVIEIAAYRVEGNRIVDEFTTFVDPEEKLSDEIIRITNITDAMVGGAPKWPEALRKFREFVGDAYLVAHNISFDAGFLRRDWSGGGAPLPPLVDTLGIARVLFKDVKNYQLGTIAKALSVSLVNAHRASDDARALARIYIEMILRLEERGVTTLDELNRLTSEYDPRKIPTQAVTLLVRNGVGIKNLYKLVTAAHLDHLRLHPRVPASMLKIHREGLLVGSGAVDGPVVSAIIAGEDTAAVEELARTFDYLEIGPPEIYGAKLAGSELRSEEGVRQLISEVVSLGERVGRPVVAVSLAHHMEPHEVLYRKILRFSMEGQRADREPSLHLRTTSEMLEELSFLGEDKAREVVVMNPKAILRELEDVPPVPREFCPPRIEGAADELRQKTYARAHELFRHGGKLPQIVAASIEKELKAIIDNGFAVLYLIAMRLVASSKANGYVVGSRGSVGSSLVAFLAGITEVNPLPPHFRCGECRKLELADSVGETAGCGPDLADRLCCGRPMTRDGYRIPFEAFMGIDGTKVPDIDLNFAGEYQPRAMAEIEQTFGRDRVFRAGTINTLKERNARGFVLKYLESHALQVRRAEIDRLSLGITEVARTTGQHPGGIVIVPSDREITDFMPVQRPAGSEDTEAITTHYDFHSYDHALVKVDVLGHDAPTAVRMLCDLTGIDPMSVPLSDPKVLSLFSSADALGLRTSARNCPVGTLGIPEFGTPLLLGILTETRPTSVEELIRISGLSHGTDVWKGNAQDLIRNKVARLSEVIATREDIMNRLVAAGVEPIRAYAIMEKVRKGKGVDPKDEALMKRQKVPGWVIEACKKIKYLFPRAHAVAYVLMALRIAWYKVHHPAAFYATYFTLKVDAFPLDTALAGERAVVQTLAELKQKEAKRETTAKEEAKLVVLEVLHEMMLRGIALAGIDLRGSEPMRFGLAGERKLRPPLMSVEGLGEKVARRITAEKDSPEVKSVEDLIRRTGLSKPLADKLSGYGAFGDLPETNQLRLF